MTNLVINNLAQTRSVGDIFLENLFKILKINMSKFA